MNAAQALDRIAALLDAAERRREESPARTFYGDPFPGILSTAEVRAVLAAVTPEREEALHGYTLSEWEHRAARAEARLDQIARLCEHPDHDLLVSAVEVRAVLAAVSPEPGGVFDDQTRKAAEAIADLHLAEGAGWRDGGREGFIAQVMGVLVMTM